jgi:hypothetical protein
VNEPEDKHVFCRPDEVQATQLYDHMHRSTLGWGLSCTATLRVEEQFELSLVCLSVQSWLECNFKSYIKWG